MPNPFRDHFDPTKHIHIDKFGNATAGSPYESGEIFDRQEFDRQKLGAEKIVGQKIGGEHSGAYVLRTAAERYQGAKEYAYAVGGLRKYEFTGLDKLHEEALIDSIRLKLRLGENLGKDELSLIYGGELYDPYSSNYEFIQHVRSQRDVKLDAPVILGCQPEVIAWGKDKINEDSRIYVGPLFKELFSHFSSLETIYTSFPEGYVSFHSVKISSRSSDEIINYYKSNGITPTHSLELELQAKYGNEWQIREVFSPINNGREAEVEIVNLTVRDLGFSERASLQEICKRAADLGLDAMTAQVALHYRLEYMDEADGSELLIPLKEHTNGPNLFALYAKVFNYRKIKCERQDPKVPKFDLNQKFSFELRPVELSEDDSLDGL